MLPSRRLSGTAAVLAPLALALVGGCVDAEVEDAEGDNFRSGKADGGYEEGSPEARGVLLLVNDASETAATLKSGAGITSRVATNIVKHRDGADGLAGTADDDRFDTLAELDAIAYVGPATLEALVERARDKGLVVRGASLDVMFSPLPAASSHNRRIEQLIRSAQHSIDIAVYSYSDAGIAAALADRVQHGVDVRFIFDTAAEDRKLTDEPARAQSKSGRIEAAGIDVRWMNKTMHHKFVIIDGPRDARERVTTAKVVMGSANWSSTAATVFDENTVFIENSAEISAAFQHEFDRLWLGSRDFAGPATAQGQSIVQIQPGDVADEDGVQALFTSHNFTPGGTDGTTWRVDRTKMELTAAHVAAISRAQSSIHVATTHMRLRPYVDALIAKKQANPSLDIKVYLDQQEYISPTADAAQMVRVETCLQAATTETQRLDCLYNDFLFSKALVDAGIDVRFKSYAYRWDHSYAAQMHSKYMVVDGSELLTGSFNHSMNAEQATFESGLRVWGPARAAIVDQFEQNFTAMWDAGRGLLAPLRSKISTDSTIPIVFPSMALTYQEFGDLRALIRTRCPAVDSDAYRTNAAAHRFCTR
jgi:phosphatidylserine/phosphatidylglycerophosphate/cardiolipin synthase-like enzyme